MNWRNIFLLVLMVLGSMQGFCVESIQAHSHFCITTPEGYPSKPLLNLLKTLNVSHAGTWKSIVEETQKAWLRPKNKERWETGDIFADKRDQVLPLLQTLGLLNEIKPQEKQFQWAVIFGGALPSMRIRMSYLVQMWNQGVRFQELIFLCGDRPLTHPQETREGLLDRQNGVLPIREDWVFNDVLPQTETDMARFLFEQAQLPEEWRSMPVSFLGTPIFMGADGTERRPNTRDTLMDLVQNRSLDGSILFVSSQPLVIYQASVVESVLTSQFPFEVVGSAVVPSVSISLCLDSLARSLYMNWSFGVLCDH